MRDSFNIFTYIEKGTDQERVQVNMRKSLKREGSPLPSELDSYSNSKRLLDELYEVFVAYRPNCTVCEKSIGKLSEHILSSHGHGKDRSPKRHRNHSSPPPPKILHSQNPERFSQSTPTDTPTRNLRIRLKRVDYAETIGIGIGDEILPKSTSQSATTNKLKPLVLPYKSPPREKANPVASASVSDYDTLSNISKTEHGGQGHSDLFPSNVFNTSELVVDPEGINIKCEIDIEEEFESIINNPDPEFEFTINNPILDAGGLIVGDLDYEIDPEYMNHYVQDSGNQDTNDYCDPDFQVMNDERAEGEQAEERTDSDDDDDDNSDSDPEYNENEKKRKGRSSPTPTKRKLKREVRAFACDQCPKKYAYHRDLVRHFRTVHPDTTEKLFQCPTCDDRFFSKRLLRKHGEEEHEGNNFTGKRKTTNASGDGDPDFDVNQEYTGTEVDHREDEDAEISYHDDDNDPEYSELNKTKSNPPRTKRKRKRGIRAFACDQCDRKYAYHRDLVHHLRTVHPDTTEKPFQCPTCHENFFSKILLRKHAVREHEHGVYVTGKRKTGTANTDGVLNFEVSQEYTYTGADGPEDEEINSHDDNNDPEYGEKITKSKSKQPSTKRKRKRGIRAFACDQCDRNYTYHRDLVHHLRTVHADTTEKPFQCPKCEEKFFSKLLLKRHVIRIHEGNATGGDEPEPSTSTDFFSEGRRTNSRKVKSKATPKTTTRVRKKEFRIHGCTECPRKYAHYRDLVHHSRTVHPDKTEKPFVCPNTTCQEKFFSRKYLRAHMKESHPNDEIHFCNKCVVAGFSSESELKTHQETHSLEGDPFMCEQCGKPFAIEMLLDRHVRLHEMKDRVRVPRPPRIRQRQTGNYSCTLCPAKYAHDRDLIRHMRTIHPDRTEKPYNCHVCQQKYFSNLQLKKHVREEHPGVNPYMCSYCGKGFWKESKYLVHKQSHTTEKRFNCEYCGKGFPTRAYLVSHLKVHTGEKPYVCEVCGKSYGTSEYFTIHKRSHTGERPYVCDKCGASFAGKSALNKHSTTHK